VLALQYHRGISDVLGGAGAHTEIYHSDDVVGERDRSDIASLAARETGWHIGIEGEELSLAGAKDVRFLLLLLEVL
jgi:hypothetical protein